MLTDLIYYDLKVAALIAVFYLFYMLLLARETTHTLNRAVLLTGLVLSAVLPLCIITLHRTVVVEGGLGTAAYEGAVPLAAPATDMEQSFNWTAPLAAVLMAGTAFILLRFARNWRRLNRIIGRGEIHTLPTGTRVSVVDAPVAPFSWMHTVVMSRADWECGRLARDCRKRDACAPILAHEEAHVRHRHSYDVVVVEVLTALQWFNPVVWFLRQELRIVHEYEADASVLSCGFDESQYIHLLMQKATGIQACALANGIHTQKTKKRIIMMLKPKSGRTAWLKALYVVPIALASLAISAKTVVHYETTATDHDSAVRVFTDSKRGDSYQIRHTPGVRFYRNGVEEQIPEGRSIALEVKKTTLKVNGLNTDQLSASTIPVGELREVRLDENGSDHFTVNLVTEEKGKTVYVVNGERISHEAVSHIAQEDIENVTVVSNKELCSRYDAEADRVVLLQTKQKADDKVFDICEQMPQFPGGDAKLMEFIARNIKYPAKALEYGVQGRVLVQFVVEKDGSLSGAKIIDMPKSSGASPVTVTATMSEQQRKDAEGHNAGVQALRDEATRVVNAMPRWTPGRQRGQAVRCKFTIPVTFRLN